MTDKPLVNKRGQTEQEYLRTYDASQFERPSVTVDMLIFTVVDEQEENYRKLSPKSLQILLVKRGEHPFLGQWALPGGFVSPRESLEDAAKRELFTETNIQNIYLEQLYTWGDVGRDPRMRVISTSYMALVDSSTLSLQAGDDADEAEWFRIEDKWLKETKTATENGTVTEKWLELRLVNAKEELSATIKITKTIANRIVQEKREIVDAGNIAFDHAKLIQYALERLRGKIEYTDIAFALMPELFTLSELQQVYEVILGKELLAAAFRRKVADKVLETNQYRKHAGHRPSKYYRFNPEWMEQS
ncbi:MULTISPECIES: NUDIX domain-containing protein [Brevibacillus]|jgi:8-oxo-dGTP diphosphatase|uniref:ADP-ribose pyrophosphatase n=1 Tax=Brevibacillus parabrevis TaxID=54914 RepID=A0A4Y3PB54_BREPA|nr:MULTISPECIES: NUDIX domain-containing protein [Brevibacillus]MDH6348458.1 8-oxo-dGTP diphosphatase [Brevibacillus sp. 1238]MDR5002393.1 NUDIX domain-containing protein [Brevibacillus parabrevis]MED2256450.1 NUDIX domain-containing protein [Brevibacillus parabrevis]NRQ52969.1 NUDIX hydrolase [Brevibacillus sp. HD1.4A]RNB96795.1 NUDIX hydrolase [Brevibacillus parabrevis]